MASSDDFAKQIQADCEAFTARIQARMAEQVKQANDNYAKFLADNEAMMETLAPGLAPAPGGK